MTEEKCLNARPPSASADKLRKGLARNRTFSVQMFLARGGGKRKRAISATLAVGTD